MAYQREKALKFIYDNLEAILPGNIDVARHKRYFDSLSDKQLAEFFKDIQAGKKWLTLTAPNYWKSTLDLERNYKLADKLGLRLHKRIWMPASEGLPAYLSPIERLVCFQPFRIASQRVDKKKSIPKNRRHVNMLTGQATGASKGASFSFPEIRLAAAMGMEDSVVELIKYRGGDNRGGAALTASLLRTGRASMKALSYFASGVESSARLQTYLACMHLKTSI